MRIALLVIGLVVMLILGVQSCAVAVGGGISEELSAGVERRQEAEALSGAGALGILAALLCAVAAGFALAKPLVSLIVFAAAAFFALIGAAASDFTDLWFWTIVLVVLSAGSYLGVREQRRKALADAPAPILNPPPAGWYADPQGGGRQRWWDGQRWTDSVS